MLDKTDKNTQEQLEAILKTTRPPMYYPLMYKDGILHNKGFIKGLYKNCQYLLQDKEKYYASSCWNNAVLLNMQVWPPDTCKEFWGLRKECELTTNSKKETADILEIYLLQKGVTKTIEGALFTRNAIDEIVTLCWGYPEDIDRTIRKFYEECQYFLKDTEEYCGWTCWNNFNVMLCLESCPQFWDLFIYCQENNNSEKKTADVLEVYLLQKGFTKTTEGALFTRNSIDEIVSQYYKNRLIKKRKNFINRKFNVS